MNSKFAALLITIVFVCSIALAQDPRADSKEVELKIIDVSLRCHGFWREPQVINDQESLEKALQTSRCEQKLPEIDFKKYTLIAISKFADCHAWVTVNATRNDEQKIYLVTIETKYGGCRGMTDHQESFLIEKVLPGYSIRFKDLKKD